MRFARTQKLLTYGLAAASTLPLILSGEVDHAWSAMLVVLSICGWFIEPPLANRLLLRRFITTAIAVVLGVEVWRYVSGGALPTLAMELSFTLLGAKLCSRGTAGDHYQIAALSFVHVIAATIAIDDLSYASSFVLFVAIAPPMLAVAYLRREMEKRFGADLKGQGPAMLERLLRSKRIISPSFVLGSAALSLPVLLITALLFVGFPRIGWGLLGKLPQNRSTVGFGDSVVLGDLDITRQDETVAMRLEPLEKQHVPMPYRAFRLRGAAFDTYSGDAWSRSRRAGFSLAQLQDGVLYLVEKSLVPAVGDDFEVMVEPIDVPVLFVPERTARIRTFVRSKAGVVRPQPLEKNALGEIRYRDEAEVGVRYEVRLSSAATVPGSAPEPADHYLDIGVRDDRKEALAAALAGTGSPAQRTARLAERLRQDYRYSLELSKSEKNPSESNPLDRFLFSRRSGTCEHFATALTILLRYQGIPARMTTGFLGAEWNPVGGYYAVRQKYAHAWTEAWIDGRWQTVDATPSASMPPSLSTAPSLALLLDALRMRWHKYIVGFDASLQLELASGMRRNFRPPSLASLHVKEIVKGLVVLVALVALFLLVRRMLRRAGILVGVHRAGPRGAEIARATALYQTLERALAAAAAPRPAGATPLEHAAGLLQNRADISTEVEVVTRRYLDVRFGLDDFAPGEFARLQAVVDGIGRTARNSRRASA
ncbi:MAG: DUF3488 and transglutaminase-like domain-containing protein [Myxococcota bacterium]|jgi:hypothetical protein|nr:DUF3488 and transglutaminase-like domain-containing protein [Myxococcota bacterium]